MKRKLDANDDEVAHEIALALAEASQRGGSPQVSQTPTRRTDSALSTPARNAEKKVIIQFPPEVFFSILMHTFSKFT